MIPSPVPSYDLFVGIDIAAATASVAWMTSKQTASRAITIDQTPQGFSLLRQRLLATGHSAKTVLIVMEATGSYWMNLATILTQAGFAVSVINPAASLTILPKRCSNERRRMQLMPKRWHNWPLCSSPPCGIPLRQFSSNSISG